MILHPTVQDFTKENGVNRYTAVIAAAKGARYIINKQNREREEAEVVRETSPVKDTKTEGVFEKENVKAVSTAIQKICNGDYKIIISGETPTK